MKVIDIKTEGGMVKGKIAFYCDALGVTRQGFYWYLKHKDMPWKYEGIAKKMREIVAEDECNDTYGRCRMYQALKLRCALPGFVDSKNEEKTERNAGYLVVSHSGGGMLRQGTRKGIRRTPANRGMRAHWVVKGLDISEDVCHGMCP